MSEEAPREEPTTEDLTVESAAGFEPVQPTLLPADLCPHLLLVPVRDDFVLAGMQCVFALCVLCGTAMVRWSPTE